MTQTAEVEVDGAVPGIPGIGEPISDAGMVTRWLSVRALEAGDPLSELSEGQASGGMLTLVASTAQEDRAGDVITASGWDLASYRENPVFLWAHDYRRPAIGKSVRTWVQDGPDGGRLMATIEFAPTPFAQEIRSLYAAGFMRGISVGFRALEMEPRTGSTGRRGVLFKSQELLEISAAPVPVNPGALARRSEADPVEVAETRDGPEVREVRHRIREFWGVLASLTGEETKSLEADRVGDN